MTRYITRFPAQILNMLHLFLLLIPLSPLVSAASVPFNPPPLLPPIGPDRTIKCHAQLGRPAPASCRSALESISAIPSPDVMRLFTPNPVPGRPTSKVPVAFRGDEPEGTLIPFTSFRRGERVSELAEKEWGGGAEKGR